jgi:hypothetical protein
VVHEFFALIHLASRFKLGREPINLQGARLARVRYAPIATKFCSAGKCRDGLILLKNTSVERAGAH